MKISYTYRTYSSSEKATEYSRFSALKARCALELILMITIVSAISLIVSFFKLFGAFRFGEFFSLLVWAVIIGGIDFYYFFARSIIEDRDIQIILTEERFSNESNDDVEQRCNAIRERAKKEMLGSCFTFFCFFFVALSDSISLIALIKGVYLICHHQNAVLLVFLSGAAICVFSYLIWRLFIKKEMQPESNSTSFSNSLYSENTDEITFCHKCGTKVLPDSVYCSKCGTKVR